MKPAGDTSPLRPEGWVAGFAVLIFCQLVGEALVVLARLAVPAFAFPGPVLGMLLLVVLLTRLKHKARSAIAVANALLGILALLFVPSAVGIMQHGALLQSWGLPLLAAVLGSTILTLLATVGAFIATEKLLSRRPE